MSTGGDGLRDRFIRHWRDLRRDVRLGFGGDAGPRIAIACSGGVDSVVLLHLLRFALEGADGASDLIVAHYDHCMRPGSAEDARWVEGLAGAWRLPFRSETARDPPRSESEARDLRYDFFRRVLEDEADLLVTAHHADDQIETVLFRTLRGTGVRGLRGIPRFREPGVLRPLLPFFKDEIEAHARAHHLKGRPDPTNDSNRYARNRLRHEVIPSLEAVHPGAKHGLLRLSRNADRTAAALDSLMEPHLGRVIVRDGDDARDVDGVSDIGGKEPATVTLRRELLLELPEPVRFELVRRAARLAGIRLSEAGTALAVQFITEGRSGGALHLDGGARVSRDFDRVRMTREALQRGRGPEGS